MRSATSSVAPRAIVALGQQCGAMATPTPKTDRSARPNMSSQILWVFDRYGSLREGEKHAYEVAIFVDFDALRAQAILMMEESDPWFCYPFSAAPSAVYLLLCRGEVVYVGQSDNVFSRIASHYQRMQRKARGKAAVYVTMEHTEEVIVFDEVRFRPCPRHELDREELALIQRYRPKHNQRMNRPRISIGELDYVKQFLAEKRIARDELKRRRLPEEVAKVERSFRTYRDQRLPITLKRVKFEEDGKQL